MLEADRHVSTQATCALAGGEHEAGANVLREEEDLEMGGVWEIPRAYEGERKVSWVRNGLWGP